jgi:hypothetical protein
VVNELERTWKEAVVTSAVVGEKNKCRRYSSKVQLRRFQMDSQWTSFGGSHFRHNLAGTRTPPSDFRRHAVPVQLQHWS